MKKIVLITFLLCGFIAIRMDAQVCKILGTNGDTIEVFNSSYSDGVITVTLSNDSQNAANVQVTVSVNYACGREVETQTYTGKVLAQPSQSSEVTISIPKSIKQGLYVYDFSSYTVVSVTGNKCD